MPRNTIELNFADGEYTFALPGPRVNELQEKTKTGIGALHARLRKGVLINPLNPDDVRLEAALSEFYYADIVETMRQGLIGGGRGKVDDQEVIVTVALANRLIENYVTDRPLVESWWHAIAITGACINGYDPPKKDEPAPKAGVSPPNKSGAKKKTGSTTASS